MTQEQASKTWPWDRHHLDLVCNDHRDAAKHGRQLETHAPAGAGGRQAEHGVLIALQIVPTQGAICIG